MARPLKIFLGIVGGFIALLAIAAIALPLLIDPNQYRDEAAEVVKKETGRELDIQGDITLNVFPWLGANVQQVTLGNAPGFGPEPFMQLQEVGVRVKLLPLLFDQRVEIGTVKVDGLTLNLAKAADGTSNWADLAEKEGEPAEPAPKPDQGPSPFTFTVGGLQITNATLNYKDAQAGTSYQVANLNVETGPVALGDPLDVTIGFVANATQPPISADVKLALKTLANLDTKVYEVQKLQLDVTTSGPTVPGGKQSMKATATAKYDQQQGTFAMPDAVVEAGGLTLKAAIQGEAMNTDAPKLGGKLSTNTFSPREVAKGFGVDLPPTADGAVLSQASFSSDYSGDFKSARLDNVALQLDQTKMTGHVHVTDFATQAIAFALKADSLDADRYLPPKAVGKKEKKDEQPAGGSGEIPIEALDAVNAKGTAELATLKLKGVTLSNVRLALDAPKGKVKVQELGAQLYGGRIVQTTRITPGPKPRYDIKAGLDGVNAGPLLQHFTGKNFLSGIGNLQLGLTTAGTTTDQLLAALGGTIAASLDKGAIEGIDLRQTLAQAKSLYKREAAPQAKQGPARTEFSNLKASGKLDDGVLTTDSLSAKGSWYTLGGDGNVSLVAQQIDYVLKPTITGGDMKELQGTTIPVRITGPLMSPSIKVDLGSVLEDRAKQEVKEELKKQEDKLKGKVGEELDRFFKKQQQKKQPPPEPQQ